MDKRALTRLRIAFLLLGAALLLPLGWLLRSVDARLEAQRRLRHELVAERIFDEMEGELTALLQREDARPSAAYAGTSTRVENWAPFVVGYFTRDAHGVRIVAKPQLAVERLNRLEAALKKLSQQTPRASELRDDGASLGAYQPTDAASGLAAPASGAGVDIERDREAAQLERARKASADAQQGSPGAVQTLSAKGFGAVPARAVAAGKSVPAAPEAVLKQLNRAADAREREAPRSKKLSKDDLDPLAGVEE